MADDDKSKEEDKSTDTEDTEAEKATEDKSDDGSKWKEMARKHERENKALLKKLKDIEDAGKTEAQKNADTAASATKRAEDAEARALRAEVAGDKNLPRDLWQFLSATTQEDLEAQADALLKATGSSDDKKGGPGKKPEEDLKGGTDPTEDPEEMDPRKLADMVDRF